MTTLAAHSLRRRPRPVLRDAARELRLLRAVVAVVAEALAGRIPMVRS